ncbi:hypothetical protein Aab01nite_53770 [Paractinoplanes abujensis]|uniref:DUF1622 domain-containing protein n=1 Tax=Paractinoplanes abujensis TaxID=882441 RepID=A0A7W7CRY8_9ACTN|nr:hypothetical protein [Actinoplanes abujensis]MBB4693553.1 hypothetical protein [Actinoplanes abujensis]GID21787.1 hypothetical protein Aab01nite_53770 [Actinoplanes abujensis]
MTIVLQYVSLACVVAGLISGAVAVAVSHDVRIGLQIALDLWVAAGLIRLGLPASAEQLLAAAAIIVVRQLVGSALRRRPALSRDDQSRGKPVRRTV